MSHDNNQPAPPSQPPSSVPTSSMQAPGTILGIVSLVCGVLGLLPSFGIVLAIAGLVLGIIARKQAIPVNNATGKTLGVIGAILSSITLIIALVTILFVGGLLGWFKSTASVGRFAGVYICEGLNSYEIRQGWAKINGSVLEGPDLTAEGPNKLQISTVTRGLTIEDVGGKFRINGKTCTKTRP